MGRFLIEAAKADSRGLCSDEVDLILPVTYAKHSARVDLVSCSEADYDLHPVPYFHHFRRHLEEQASSTL
jgi:hypothetical protein